MIAVPDKSRITVEYKQGQEEITIPQPKRGIFSVLMGDFMVF